MDLGFFLFIKVPEFIFLENNYLLVAFDCALLIFGTPEVSSFTRIHQYYKKTPISFDKIICFIFHDFCNARAFERLT